MAALRGVLGIVCILMMVACLCGCNRKTGTVSLASTETTSYTFPKDWLGYWQGELSIYNAGSVSQVVPMALDYQATDDPLRYTWAIIYGQDTVKGRRAYELVVIDSVEGNYQIDEKNSIMLDAYLRGNSLVSAFEVMGNHLVTTTTRIGDQISFDIIMSKAKEGTSTGGEEVGGERIPVVTNYPIAVRQSAILHRVR